MAIADGSSMQCQFVCRNFKWTLQGIEFESDVLHLPLGSCDLVLGVQWLSTLGTIKWNFEQLRMEFMHQGKNNVLRGLAGGKIQMTAHEQLPKALKTAAQICMLQLVPDTM